MDIYGIYNHQSYRTMWMGASGNDVNGCVGKHCVSTKNSLFLLWESWWVTSGSGDIFRQSHNFPCFSVKTQPSRPYWLISSVFFQKTLPRETEFSKWGYQALSDIHRFDTHPWPASSTYLWSPAASLYRLDPPIPPTKMVNVLKWWGKIW